MKKTKLQISYKNGFIHIVEKDKGDSMGTAYDGLDPTNEDDQKQILREIGKVRANMMVGSPSSLAHDMGMPNEIIKWLDDSFAYFVIGVEIE